jgi:hypothetical protein
MYSAACLAQRAGDAGSPFVASRRYTIDRLHGGLGRFEGDTVERDAATVRIG